MIFAFTGRRPFSNKSFQSWHATTAFVRKSNRTLTELTGRAATLVLDVFANDDKIVLRGHLFTHSFALHDDDESLGKKLRVVRGSQTQTWRFCCMAVGAIHRTILYDTKLEGEAEHENLLSARKFLQKIRVLLMFFMFTS